MQPASSSSIHAMYAFSLSMRVDAEERDREENAGEHDQEERDAVDAEVPRDAERRDPLVERHELEATALSIEGDEQRDAQGAGEDRGERARRPCTTSSRRVGSSATITAEMAGSEHERRQDREVHQTLTREKNHASSSTAPAAMPSA